MTAQKTDRLAEYDERPHIPLIERQGEQRRQQPAQDEEADIGDQQKELFRMEEGSHRAHEIVQN